MKCLQYSFLSKGWTPIILSLAFLAISCDSGLAPRVGTESKQPALLGRSDQMDVLKTLQDSVPLSGTWEPQQSGTNHPLGAICFVNPEEGWTISNYGEIFHTKDGGQSWMLQKSGTTKPLSDIYFADSQHGWAVSSLSTYLRTTNGGDTWQSGLIVNNYWTGVFFINDQQGWMVGFEPATSDSVAGRILYSDDGGVSWTLQKRAVYRLLDIQFVESSDGLNGWAVGDNGTILHSPDGGKTWQKQPIGLPNDLNSVYFVDDKNGWSVGNLGLIVHTSDGGATWHVQENESVTEQGLYSVFFTDSLTGWATGSLPPQESVILHTNDGGVTWDNQKSGTKNSLASLSFVNKYDGWAAGGGGTILHYSELPHITSVNQGLKLLTDQVKDLQNENVLNHGQANALLTILQAVSRQVVSDKYVPASNQLHAFINKVKAFQHNGILNDAQANKLNTLAGETLKVMTGSV